MKSNALLKKAEQPEAYVDDDENAETVPLPTLQNQIFAEAELLTRPSAQLDEILELIRSVDEKLEKLLNTRQPVKKTARKKAKKTTKKTAKKTAKKRTAAARSR